MFQTKLLPVILLIVTLLAVGALADPHGMVPPSTVRAATPALAATIRLPIIQKGYPWQSPFGVESWWRVSGVLLDRAEDLGTSWYRLNRVSWRAVQPDEGGAYDWSVLAGLDDELRKLRAAGMTPIVIVHHSPRWATINEPFETDCGAVRADKFGAMAAFMQALVERYKQPEFGVHYWELGNEPDVDPNYVLPDSVFGCWGDVDDPYYGGRHYGEMLKVVYPAIKAADPRAQVLVGGLLLGQPYTDPGLGQGQPELFLNGILEAGAGDYFDILPYHAYPVYLGQAIDYDNAGYGPWQPLGGWVLGKARFLRQVMASYGIEKPLFVDETALGCAAEWYDCDPVPPGFFEAQADYLPRTFCRALSEGIEALLWYTLEGPGWRNGGLLDETQTPRPAYWAYQHLVTRLRGSTFQQAVDYGSGIEAYSFTTGPREVHVVWSTDTVTDPLLVPQALFVAAYDIDGDPIVPIPVGSDYQLSAGFSPIYIERLPAGRD